ncbi:MAG TPA: YciI family protein [Parvularculaceae bacterium]|nr:YciI family protein [Parvularculaceae bacterium]
MKGETGMHAMILAFESPGDFARRQDKAQYKAYMEGWYAYGGSLEKAGVLKSGGALLGPETATVISLKDGKRVVEDGPFTDSKEQLGGFFIIEVGSIDEAAKWAKSCPAAKEGRVDVRAVPDDYPIGGE